MLKITPLGPWHGGADMKFTYFYHNCWKKVVKYDRSHAIFISRITKAIMKNCNNKKIKNNNKKINPLTVKN